MSAAEQYDAPSEQDELEALRAAVTRPMGQAQIDAEASEWLRRMAETQADIDRYQAAQAIEIERINTRYAKETDRLQRRYSWLEQAVEALALRSDFGKAKSRRVGNGVFGTRGGRDKLLLPPEESLLPWAKASLPAAVYEVVSTKVVRAYYAETGDLPPGAEVVAGKNEPFATPDVNL